MKQQQRWRKVGWMTGLMFVGLVFVALISFFHPLTWTNRTDGMAAVILGLYICSHPTANLLDLMLFGRQIWFAHSRKANYVWVGFNLAVIVAGWMVIVAGTTRFMEK